ncbi:MAG: hypothetical protein WD404_05060 [Solirubrobacterales bacterium]
MRGAGPASIAVCALTAALLCLSACGDGEGDGTAAGRGTGAEAERRGVADPGKPRCARPLRRFVAALDSLRGTVAVGVTYDTYLARVREVRARYQRVPAGRLAVGCLLAAAAPAERALNSYLAAANTWGDCLADTSCRVEAIEAKLQRAWNRASNLLSQAQLAAAIGGGERRAM